MGSPLETFYILFKTDASDVEKGTKKAKGGIEDLEASIGGADKGATTLGKNFNILAGAAVAAFGVALAITKVLSAANTISAEAKDLNTLGEVLGESTRNLTNWGRAVQRQGGTVEGFNGTVKGLSGQLNDTLINGVNSTTEALSRMGVNILDTAGNMKTVLTILPEVSEKFKNLNRETSLAFGKQLGLDEGTILLLQKGGDEVRNLVAAQEALNKVSEADIKRLTEIRTAFQQFENRFSDFKTEVLIGALDIFDNIAAKLENSKGFIDEMVGGFKALVDLGREFFGFGPIGGGSVTPLVGAAGANTTQELSPLGVIPPLAGAAGARTTQELSPLGVIPLNRNASPDNDAVADAIRQGFNEVVKPNLLKILTDLGFLGTGALRDRLQAEDVGAEVLRNKSLGFLIDATKAKIATDEARAAGGVGSRTSTVNIEELNVITPATDVEGIARDISGAIESQLQNAIDNTDDGIAA